MKLRSSQRCCICQEECNNAVTPGSCVGKSHFCCEKCLVTWAREHSTCPYCRAGFTTIVTPHGYVLARQVKPSGLVMLYIRSKTHEVIDTLQMHVSWVPHMAEAVTLLNRCRTSAASLLQEVHIRTISI